ncbi:MAG: ATP phosphoribosyltransferase [Tepidibacter sp.]|uniref:ATP phosphoribosyltransferase n=1 Tax=Tepidibacter sp. TaxID=2529387 RepID=UPI0025F50308|nr:ATP phosphoribosyltransferase [Tepidibacter sp.]MCT4508281.1 ATP phosphoribosyltransferase [Tepidibacter sp.]
MDYITIALSKGRIGKQADNVFKKIGLGDCIDLDSRKLIFKDDINKINYIYVKASDVVTYVEKGVTDLGIVGKDTILESDTNVYEIFDLGFGKCKFSIAGIKGEKIYIKDDILKVATKYLEIAKKYFNERQQKIEIIKLNGSVELAPLVGLSDVIVDLVETGNTLKANGLEVIEDMFNISARLISNRVSYRFKFDRIQNIIKSLNENMEG